MPAYICKLDGLYFEWSTIVDAPRTYGMTLEEFTAYYQDEYGHSAMVDFDDRMLRVEAIGTSSRLHRDIADLIAWNRAGVAEGVATRAEIVAMLKALPSPSPEPDKGAPLDYEVALSRYGQPSPEPAEEDGK